MSLCILLRYPLESLSLDHANNALHPGGGVQSDIQVEALARLQAIARNRGHFAPVINCQRNLIFKMADRSQGKRVSYDILNNLTTVDLLCEEKSKKKTSSKNILGVYQAERLITSKQDGDVSKTVLY